MINYWKTKINDAVVQHDKETKDKNNQDAK